ncbi:MAG: phosphatidate cytidylyltransferase [Nitrospiria bacterium]
MVIRQSRLLTAILLLPAVAWLIWNLSPFLFFIFISMAILRAQYEYYLLFFPEDQRRPIVFGLGLGFCLLSMIYFRLPLLAGVTLLSMSVLLYTLSTRQEIDRTLTTSAALSFGIMYIAGFLGHLILIRHHPQGRELIVMLLLMIWGGDAGAYYVGRRIGRHKLAPRISPNKTVEGAIGGLVVTFLGGLLAKSTFLPLLSWGAVAALSLLLGVFGQMGDLAESMLKRSAGVKDSSALVPAHGGLFDKLDSIAFAAPLLYYYLIVFKI